MAEISWTAEAERWLRDIYDYIAQDNPESASRVVDGIYEKAQLLRRFPEIGHRYDAIPDRHVRILLYGHYRIAYLIKPDGNIDILGVFHGALDIDRYLR
ncbi:MAG: type II toxin-antitoxin system RelE/ParE family toxin [bacterium]|nr:type II toxin-antitoxin system RelE/ParE family toxin [bacterium]